ncbi:MAG: NifB/NifX family molybdenum-iron cluster-binding protein [Candidatus Omnitrophica bacterium]|nr:NifB/NifX family molybdenum-iron cluster-binding protein [Candidatus Omnitrophota bacterium]
MKIAIPLVDNCLSQHFGHCEKYALVEVDEAKKEILTTILLDPPPHEPGFLPNWLHERGANVIICGGMGARAVQLFDHYGVEVVVGAPAEKPEKVVKDYLSGSLTTGSNVCDH